MPDAAADAARFIQAHLPLVPVPGVPEIRVHKAHPASGLRRLIGEDAAAPYWAHHWGGGLALARYVLDRPECVAGRRVVDVGAGSGVVAIAAAMAGAAWIGAAEIDPIGRVAIRLNAAANGVEVEVLAGDLLGSSPPAAEVILIGDLFYDAATAARATAFADRCVTQGLAVLIGDPWRAHLPTGRLRHLADYRVSETGVERAAAVFAFS